MKRILLWTLVVHLATGYNPVAELMRMPLLFEHYQVHCKSDSSLSFTHFLQLHYFDHHHRQSDKRHTGLPMQCGIVLIPAVVLPHPPAVTCYVVQVFTVAKDKMPLEDEVLCSSMYGRGIFRPPIA